MSKNLIDSIEGVLENLNEVENLNCGGCGISALAIARYIRKHVNPRARLKFGFLEGHRANEDGSRPAPAHVVVIWRNHRIDSEGVDSGQSYSWRLTETLDEAGLLASINVGGGWNPWFDRAAYVPEIEAITGVDLSDVDCYA